MTKQKPHIVHTLGYTHCPAFPSLTEARAHLKALVAESLAGAKRKSKTARKHKLDADAYEITLGADSRSALWARHYIAEA